MTTGSSPASSSLLFLGLCAPLAAAGCVEEVAREHGTESFRVTIMHPTDLGSEAARLPDSERDVTYVVQALDDLGQPDPSFSGQVDVYVHFLGTLTPPHAGPMPLPLTTVNVSGGMATASLTLDIAFGPTLIWVEDARDATASFATGVSPEIWFRDPFLEDISRPVDENAISALERSPLERKQVKVSASKHGAAGHLVVTGVYTQGYTVSDVETATLLGHDYGHMFVFTFGRPRAEDGTAIEVGHLVKDVSGGVSEFNGFTELGFPQTVLASTTADASKLPQPVVIDPDWLLSPGPSGMINLEKVESGLVAVDGGVVCPSDDDFETFGQWKLDVGFGCGKPINVITAGTVSDFDPFVHQGMPLARVVGTLKAVNIGTFSVWIVLPRSIADITVT